MSNGNPWDGEDRRKSGGNGTSVFERHLQTGFGGIATVALIWMGSSVIDLTKEMVKTSTQLAQVREDMKQLQDQFIRGTADRYTASEARRDLGAISASMQKIEDRMDRMEQRRPRNDR